MWIVDGSMGEGGGQVLRTSLTLSMCKGVPVRINNIRTGRNKPGLLRQHLACVKAAQQICDAKVTGDEIGSQEVFFKPGRVKAGRYHFAVGSAGSSCLVFQTVMMPLLLLQEKSELYLEGGTHNGKAPSFDFISKCFLPVVSKMGLKFEADLERYGFYPSGGGAWRANLYPASELSPLDLLSRGEGITRSATAISANIPAHINRRELAQVHRLLQWCESELHAKTVSSQGAGNILSLGLEFQSVNELVEVVGERGKSAERVASIAVEHLRRYLESGAPVGEYLADQLLLPMVLGGGGEFVMAEPSEHFKTNVTLINDLSDRSIEYQQTPNGCWEVVVSS